MTTPPRIIVVGATGSLGGAVSRSLLTRRIPFTALVRRPHDSLVHPLIDQQIADLGDRKGVRRALQGASSAFYVSPHDAAETDYARIFVDEAERARVRIVFAGVHSSRRTLSGRIQAALIRRLMPAYRGKLALSADIEKRASNAVLFAATSFFQNDEMFLDEIRAGRYPVPVRGFNMISTTDVGEIAAHALIDPNFATGSHTLMGPRSMSGPDLARAWSQALGLTVEYTGNDAAAWDAVMAERFPPGRKGSDYRAAFASLAKNKLPTQRRHIAATTALLGRPPQDYVEWARSVILPSPSPAADDSSEGLRRG